MGNLLVTLLIDRKKLPVGTFVFFLYLFGTGPCLMLEEEWKGRKILEELMPLYSLILISAMPATYHS